MPAVVVIALILLVPAFLFFVIGWWVKNSDKHDSENAKLFVGLGCVLSLAGAAILMTGIPGTA